MWSFLYVLSEFEQWWTINMDHAECGRLCEELQD